MRELTPEDWKRRWEQMCAARERAAQEAAFYRERCASLEALVIRAAELAQGPRRVT